MKIPEKILELTELFDRNRDAYLSGQYNEADIRIEFINPLFIALGWDVNNDSGYAPQYRDVIHEAVVKVGGVTKAPDYSFRIGGTRKFFLEAKKPSVDIKGDTAPAFQLRRYAWSAKMPLSILTDFEEFAVYDCRIRPVMTDKTSKARVIYFTYKDYSERWGEIADIFSKDAVLQGKFDRYFEDGKSPKDEVDAEFLKEIESWREVLAKNIAIRNTNLTTFDLNFAVQKTIDRLIFLRVCEDRGIEVQGQLKSLLNGENTYKRLVRIFNQADDKYNSGLFHFQSEKDRPGDPDGLTLSLDIDDRILKEIVKNLYYPDSPYEFSVLPADILGQVYEQFLGKVIRLTPSHQAKVEEKPEVKKAGGVYYTPTYIVDYIVENTVGELLEGSTPRRVSKMRVLDPACGSGSFLIGAYQRLLDWHREWYEKDGVDKNKKALYEGAGGEWQLTTTEKKRILLNNIYGVDIDHQAVEVTKLSLLLKVLEGESEETINSQLRMFHERALPDLGNNIKCGNSLIGHDFYDNEQMSLLDSDEKLRINVFDWEAEFGEIMAAGGFDAVIGNPPYGADLSDLERNYLEDKFEFGNTDTACLFMGLATRLLNKKGMNGFIVPKPFVYSSNWMRLRNYLISNIVEIVDCGKVWKEVKLEQVVYLYSKSKSNKYRSSVRNEKKFEYLGEIDKETFDEFGFILNGISDKELEVGRKARNAGRFLNDFVVNQRGSTYQRYIIENKSDYKVLGGKQISRYFLSEEIKGYIEKKKIQDEKAFIKSNSILVQRIVAHIQNPIDHIKIIATVPNDIKKDDYIIVDTINQLENTSKLDTGFIISIINSKLISWYAYRFIFGKAIRTMQFDNPVTKRIPLPLIDLTKQNEKAQHDKMVSHVNQMLDLHKKLSEASTPHEKTALKRQIDATDNQIDKLVYALYDLTDEEIAIVEG